MGGREGGRYVVGWNVGGEQGGRDVVRWDVGGGEGGSGSRSRNVPWEGGMEVGMMG